MPENPESVYHYTVDDFASSIIRHNLNQREQARKTGMSLLHKKMKTFF